MLEKVKERLYSKIKVTPSGCWEWQGFRMNTGYGKLTVTAMNETLTHRISYIIHCGQISKESCVLHKCDNRPCVNPEHLFLGDRKVNYWDMRNKNRHFKRAEMTHCFEGHEFTKENTVIKKNGNRRCRICRTEKQRIYKAKKKHELLHL